jgi:hypothetical protein
MTEPITPVAIPDGCDKCPNRLPVVKRKFLDITQRSAFAFILTLFLPLCFVRQTDSGAIVLKDEPNVPVLMILLPIIGVCIGIDITPKLKA